MTQHIAFLVMVTRPPGTDAPEAEERHLERTRSYLERKLQVIMHDPDIEVRYVGVGMDPERALREQSLPWSDPNSDPIGDLKRVADQAHQQGVAQTRYPQPDPFRRPPGDPESLGQRYLDQMTADTPLSDEDQAMLKGKLDQSVARHKENDHEDE